MGPKWGSPRRCGWLAGRGFASHPPLIWADRAGSRRHGPIQRDGGGERCSFTIKSGNQSLRIEAEILIYICRLEHEKNLAK